ncbi:GNAT family N-acetyltransferase [Paenibacillus oceani]|uniref:GNAT family N-acetyltransferase n=1 Tax=Paenibacillus oceani TaxID=2772510 RepID=A0A927H381_9BACL|nr:GNAT family N-acetyltransferase [Paenibacillus oceani]MBD2866148.1 GNAT family N-acetyltransferase [Paenibacillus oceani]
MHKQIEERSLNAWPALQTFLYDGWLLRFADGYTKRSNSIQPLYAPEMQSGSISGKVRRCESLYTSAGLDTIFKITPFITPGDLDPFLEERGYERVDPTSVKTAPLTGLREPSLPEIRIEETLSTDWLRTMAAFQHLSETNQGITARLLQPSCLKKGFFTLYKEGKPVACGLGVIEQGDIGLYDIVTNPNERNKGYGEQLILHMLQWARREGAARCYLLVVQQNLPAVRLYEKLNFQEIYTYWYRVKKRTDLPQVSD